LEADLLPGQAPMEPGEQLIQGELQPCAEGSYRLLGVPGAPEGGWPLITLEPALHHWLAQAAGGPVRLIGVPNPWGPWLRVSRLAS
jgi:hypothetical protein